MRVGRVVRGEEQYFSLIKTDLKTIASSHVRMYLSTIIESLYIGITGGYNVKQTVSVRYTKP